MSEVNNKEVNQTSKVEVKRIRSRNTYDSINQIIETFNSSNGWALKKVSMLGMNIDIVVERSVDQASNSDKATDTKPVKDVVSVDTKESSNAKQVKEEVAKTSEPQAESKEVVVDVEDAPDAKPAAKRGRATTKK